MNFLCEYNLPLNISDDHGISLTNDLRCERRWTFYRNNCILLKSSVVNKQFDGLKSIGKGWGARRGKVNKLFLNYSKGVYSANMIKFGD